MANLQSFKGLRYADINLNTLVCPPYDVISEKQREEYIAKNPNNIIRLELPRGSEPYKQAGDIFQTFLQNRILVEDEQASIYVYEMEFCSKLGGSNKSVKGFVSLVKLEEFSSGIILPHEETLSKAKTDRFNLMKETFCNFSQIYSLYTDENKSAYTLIDSCSKSKPDMEIVDNDGTVHRMWCVNDGCVINKIKKIFEDKKLYIADGHHRYETALNFHKYLKDTGAELGHSDYVMMMLVDMENDGLVVYPTHRIVKDLKNFNSNELCMRCKKYFDIIDLHLASELEQELSYRYNNGQKAFGLFLGNNNYKLLVLKNTVDNKSVITEMFPKTSSTLADLDVTILHSLILEQILGIDKDNMANQINLTYTRNLDEAINEVETGIANCSFILSPTRVSQIKDVALAGDKMPQKSTYFYPKLITGMVINNLKGDTLFC